ncbi:hypothetical protein [Kitasatospora sp. NPDC001547]|uniref:hypothetical protein n=1 Tax=Kitasatospora sp. NPDC001547 TaxID=3364015 RepID=UPI0036A3F93A|nr:hypothetical protein KitaXyl93_56850 [Kitasatospora sp. Xyl93]
MDAVFTLALRHDAGRVFPEDLPMAAAELLARGIGGESPALCELAGRSGRGERAGELTELLRQATEELGLPVLDEELVERCRMYETAVELVSGELSPDEVAVTAWHWTGAEATEAERRFVAAVDEAGCPDCLGAWPEELARAWVREVTAAAAGVLAGGDPRTAAGLGG